MTATLLGARWLLGLVLLYAAFSKLHPTGRERLSRAIANYGAVPVGARTLIAMFLPWAELLLAVLMLLGIAILPVAVVSGLLFGGFATVVGWQVARGHSFDCGCGFGSSISWRLVAGDLILCLIAVGVVVGPSGSLAAWPGPGLTATTTPPVSLLPIPFLAVLGPLSVRLAMEAVRLPGHWSKPRAGVRSS